MAWNLDDAGYELLVYNRSDGPTEPFADAGIEVAESPRELGQQADVVITMVTDDEALAAVLDGPDGLLTGINGSNTVIQMSTVTPDATLAAAETVRAQNSRFVDAPVSGTVGPAEEGTLTVLAGGEDDVLDDVEAILEAMGEPVVRCGGVGDGARMKLFVNLLLGDMMSAYAEALTFGAAQDLNLDAMQQVVEAGAVDSPLFRYQGPVDRSTRLRTALPGRSAVQGSPVCQRSCQRRGADAAPDCGRSRVVLGRERDGPRQRRHDGGAEVPGVGRRRDSRQLSSYPHRYRTRVPRRERRGNTPLRTRSNRTASSHRPLSEVGDRL